MEHFRQRIVAFRNSPFGGIGIYFSTKTDGLFQRGTMVMVDIPRGQEAFANEPLVSINEQNAQELMDTLWQCGMRPSEGTGSAGSLAATQRHLDDMRKIVGSKLGVTL